MTVKVVNNVPDITATVNKSEDGSVTILLTENSNKVNLGTVEPGSVVEIGKREYIVLDHSAEATAIIAKELTKEMCFGDTDNYVTSDVRTYCNGEFLNELAADVGMDNIIEHIVNLTADDGTGKGKTCKDKVSIITTENYRRYREFLEAYADWWWTATKVTYSDGYPYDVFLVDSNGVLGVNGCDCRNGIRPFCVLNSSVEVIVK